MEINTTMSKEQVLELIKIGIKRKSFMENKRKAYASDPKLREATIRGGTNCIARRFAGMTAEDRSEYMKKVQRGEKPLQNA